ncbi:MAG: aspartate-semialdehyde dehydrogenase [Bacteroidales bacterium]|nr:aspartate-semialdehyde dehydrogenase [Bacteroidales bacterium]
MKKSLAIVGATGVVGTVVLKVLEEFNLDFETIIPVASSKSVGKYVTCFGRKLQVIDPDSAVAMKPDFAIFSAGKVVSKKYAPLFAEAGTIVIDNSSAWRMDKGIPLVVPEINSYAIGNSHIIANPNCSTIQMVLALSKLHERLKIKRIVVSTYQSVSGSGKKGLDQLQNETNGNEFREMAYHYPIFCNVIPHAGEFVDNGYTDEEMKLVNETRKILNDYSIEVSATAARVPVTGGHSESVNVEFHNDFDIQLVYDLLADTPGVTVIDNPSDNKYPMPLFSKGKNDVFVGRIRKDLFQPKTLNMWVVSDNLRKGAATNAVQILQTLL